MTKKKELKSLDLRLDPRDVSLGDVMCCSIKVGLDSTVYLMATPQRRVSARRGSTTAPDPFGVHTIVNLNPNRSSSSTLTIVRVPASPATPNLNEPPTSPVLGQRRFNRRNAGGAQANERVSFAFSSFGGPRPSSPSNSRDHPPSPSSSPRLRPSSPHSHVSSFGGKPRLTPDQLVDLARQSTNPKPNELASPPVTAHDAQPVPATFTPLPDDIYLPFIERPAEIAALISSPPDVKLFSLLAQTFSSKLPSQPSDPSSAIATFSDKPLDLPRDPTQWTYPQLIYHLTRVDRDIAPDFIWAIASRKCILSHSELIWERIKGALGIPPELDIEYDFLDDDQESPDTSDISDDEGRGARGHWSDWDAVMDSPIDARNFKRLSAESPATSIYLTRREEQDAQFRSQIDDKLQGLQEGFIQSSTTPHTAEGGEDTIVPTPHGVRSPPERGIVIGDFTPPLDTEGDYLSIEPLLAPANHPPPPLPTSLGAADGLGDIAEGAEEEETELGFTTSPTEAASTVTGPASADRAEDPNFITPSQIQGLRISTSPVPPSSSFGTPPVLSPISPLPPYPSVGTNSSTITTAGNSATQPQNIPSSGSYSSSRSHSRASSFSSIGPFQRSESIGNLSASWSAAAAIAAASGSESFGLGSFGGGGGSQYGGSAIGSDAGDSSGYISDGDRLPGHPLFVSNFARLTGGPTMKAK